MIDYDSAVYPAGTLGWQALLQAVEAAEPADESDWIEFKAYVDLRERVQRPVLAKSIIAFANRDPALAARHLDGRALIVVGLEPGCLVGAPLMDSAQLHDAIQPWLSEPAVGWDFHYVQFNGKQVLVLTVQPPRQGDPIHCVAKDGDKVRNGEVSESASRQVRPCYGSGHADAVESSVSTARERTCRGSIRRQRRNRSDF